MDCIKEGNIIMRCDIWFLLMNIIKCVMSWVWPLVQQIKFVCEGCESSMSSDEGI